MSLILLSVPASANFENAHFWVHSDIQVEISDTGTFFWTIVDIVPTVSKFVTPAL